MLGDIDQINRHNLSGHSSLENSKRKRLLATQMTDIATWIEDAANRSSPPSDPISIPTFQRPSWEDVCRLHQIPPVLSEMKDLDRMGVAYAYTTLDVLKGQAHLAEQKYHQQILLLRTYELEYVEAEKKHQDVRRRLDTIVDLASSNVSATELAPDLMGLRITSPPLVPYEIGA